MIRLALLVLGSLCLDACALNQRTGHSSMPGMPMPDAARNQNPQDKAAADTSAAPAGDGPRAPRDTASEVSSHSRDMPSMPDTPAHSDSTPPEQAATSEHADMPGMEMPEASGEDMEMQHDSSAQEVVPQTPPPPAPGDHAADRFFDPVAMATARAELRREHGGGAVPYSKVMMNLLEYQTLPGPDGYRWDGQAWFGGDLHRLVLRSEGGGIRGEGAESAEAQALYSRALGVYTDVQIGVREDFEPTGRTYATAGFQTLFPYWFEAEALLFLSTQGDLLGRLEGTYDVRITNRLILQPRAELSLAAQNTAATRTGSGLSQAELGLRLRYEIRREFAPYAGISYDHVFGNTADLARSAGDATNEWSFVAGLRVFF